MTDEWPVDTLRVADLLASGWRAVPFQQFILKVHSRCNLACDYCYMYEMADRTWSSKPKVMSSDVMALSCRRIAEHAARHRLDRVKVVLHGGEPLLAGAGMLAEIAATLRRELPDGCALDLRVQTNGVLLDEKMLDSLAAHDIRVGVSLDGSPAAHDRHRRHANGRGSHAEAARALRLLGGERYRRLFAGLLCVIDLDADPLETYESLLAFGPPQVDFLLPQGNWSVPVPRRSADEGDASYGDWLVTIFDRWYDAPRRETEVRLFAEIVNLVLGGQSQVESVGLSPVALIVVDTDGSLEQVDTLRSAYHGAAATELTVADNSFDEALRHPAIAARQIGLAALGETCQQCGIRRVCGGGHYSHRYRRGSGFRHASVYCADLTRLITHVIGRVHTDLAALRPGGR
ncbi:FxsB family cyclophane-forming radical SAM/SPASM peptide maturase [Solihabitans fulvus]|uniref:FxsB family cyclophane-forming radical SAM/SPASM peptide maturase n=1 Tax=Solihabitans fulvus TaxID=1892852 RepID=UPI001CB76115|nr:FxsB family cyclophane-forming radical SAM/SPASM peptide maturase [Solihabitans fulvus]